MSHKSSTQVALGGLSAALCLVIMLGTVLVPFATYAIPALAGIALIPIAMELGLPVAGITYAVVSLLSLLMVPDREAALMFIAFFGYYPILKFKLDRLKFKLLRMLLKVTIFNVAILAGYFVVIYIFGLYYLMDELTGGFGWLLLGAGNLFFAIYELTLRNITMLYLFRIRKILFRK
ncbi:hypothetical protein ACS3UN_08735 [Oscillospiraceae bacterium LTW-04]|nr:hypothetical protein RBH76_01620 [Oscillospiraceae bacterium MB24-C1]